MWQQMLNDPDQSAVFWRVTVPCVVGLVLAFAWLWRSIRSDERKADQK
jgi:hypothetical protein